MVIAGALVILFALGYFVYHTVRDEYDNVYRGVKEYIPLSFKDFETYYNLSPEKYRLEDHPVYLNVVSKECYSPLVPSYTVDTIKFNFFDWKKYKRWLKNKRKREAAGKRLKMEHDMTLRYLESVQKDIVSMQARAERELHDAKRITEAVKNNTVFL